MRFLAALLTAFVVLSVWDGTSGTAGEAGTAVQANQSSAVAGARESSASTSARQEIVDFSLPVSKEIHEILVTGPSPPAIETLDDLAGQTVNVRLSSSYYESLQSVNQRLLDEGKPEIDIQAVSELLEDEDLLEMVQTGLLPWVVVDDYKAKDLVPDIRPADGA